MVSKAEQEAMDVEYSIIVGEVALVSRNIDAVTDLMVDMYENLDTTDEFTRITSWLVSIGMTGTTLETLCLECGYDLDKVTDRLSKMANGKIPFKSQEKGKGKETPKKEEANLFAVAIGGRHDTIHVGKNDVDGKTILLLCGEKVKGTIVHSPQKPDCVECLRLARGGCKKK